MSRTVPFSSPGLYAPPFTLSSSNTSVSTVVPSGPSVGSSSRLMLRVNTDTRARSNSANSPVSRFFDGPGQYHQASRSLSHAPESPGPSTASLPLGGAPMSISQTLPHSGTNARDSSPITATPRSTAAGALDPELSPIDLIQKALAASPDHGETLDLSRNKLEVIGDVEVEMFRRGMGKDSKGVWRLALSYNALRDHSLSSSFAKLHRLRYLNLKGNHFTEFPYAILSLPALEILDMSKNRLSSFPDTPGRLAHLKVLSLSHNTIYTLPTYLTTFIDLKVFKIDNNPIEWPPREVLGPLLDDDGAASRRAVDEDAPVRRKDEGHRPWIENMKSWMRTRAKETNRLLAQSEANGESYTASEEEPTSAVSASSGYDRLSPWGSTDTAKRLTVEPHPHVLPPALQHVAHTRGSSYNSAQRLSANLTAKKSLPDMRLSHARIIEERREGKDGARPLGLAIVTDSTVRNRAPVKSWGENQLSQSSSPLRGPAEDFGRMMRTGSVDPLRRTKATVGAEAITKRGSQDGPEVDESRNSYFRRLSMLPASTISKSVSPALLRFVDAVRGILFALTQFHSALRQFLLFAVSDRVAGVFARVMEPASGYLTNLINALDRFDSVSRRQAPLVHALSVDVRPVTPASATLFDDDLLDVIETATEVAFTVWLRLAEEIGTTSPPVSKHGKSDSTGSTTSALGSVRLPAFTSTSEQRRGGLSHIPARAQTELVQLLSHAEQVTTVLRESTMALRANPHSYARATLSEDAQAFIKTVVRVSELVKAITNYHTFGSHVRQSLSRLTQATRECAILMQVSSLRPGSATPGPQMSARPSSPRYHAASSSEDLPSAGYPPPSAAWRERDHQVEHREGLRGLHLPSRQAALGRNRINGSLPVVDARYARDEFDPPVSARRTGLQNYG
ncbi:RAM signaling network component [Cryptotrichosporon argae]